MPFQVLGSWPIYRPRKCVNNGESLTVWHKFDLTTPRNMSLSVLFFLLNVALVAGDASSYQVNAVCNM